MADQDHVETQEVSAPDIADRTTVSRGTTLNTSSGMDRPRPVTRSSGQLVDWADAVDDQLMDEAVLQISGAGHSVDFLVDSGYAVTALSCSFYQALVRAGAPVGALRSTPRKLRGANGSPIDILGCSSGVRFEHRRHYRYIYLGLDTTTHLGHKEWIAVYGGRCITSVASQRRRIVRPRFHHGALFNSPVF